MAAPLFCLEMLLISWGTDHRWWKEINTSSTTCILNMSHNESTNTSCTGERMSSIRRAACFPIVTLNLQPPPLKLQISESRSEADSESTWSNNSQYINFGRIGTARCTETKEWLTIEYIMFGLIQTVYWRDEMWYICWERSHSVAKWNCVYLLH